MVEQSASRLDRAAKRTLDILLAIVGLVLSSPLWVIIAVAIKLDDGGPVLYRQKRWGRNERPFDLFKFRSMVPHSDRTFGITQAESNDARVTRVGRVLRATGMDELPQFLNILKGDMSFVGPRALAVEESLIDEYGQPARYENIPDFRSRLAVRPGLTGMATIYVPKDSPPSTKLEYDLKYIEEQSFWLDVRLILLSLWISLRGRWESRDHKL